MILIRFFPRLTATLAAAAVLAASPLSFDFDSAQGGFILKDNVAHARSGADDSQHDDRKGRGADESDDHLSGGSDDDGPRSHRDEDDGKDGHRKGRGHKGKKHNRPTPPVGGPVTPVKVERSANEIEVSYSDGTKEEIEHGRYERKNAYGRTIEERPATQADIDRLSAF